LFRYSLRTHAARITSPSEQPHASFDPGQRYRLSPHACVLRELHDVSEVLTLVARAPNQTELLDDGLMGELGTYLLVVSSGEARTYEIDLGVAAILELFDVPRTGREVSRRVERLTGRSVDETLTGLTQLGALAPSPKSAARARRTEARARKAMNHA
jgi:hypothetical protein